LTGSETPSWFVRDDPTSGLPYCGDGLVNQSSENCDDGNADDTDHCTNRCLMQEPVEAPDVGEPPLIEPPIYDQR
jgi:cysteine-rich repeat protein